MKPFITCIVATSLFAASQVCGQHSSSLSPSANVASLEEAKAFVIGTWTNTGQSLRLDGKTLWTKLVFKSDGTVEYYETPAAADEWRHRPLNHTFTPTI
jgi:hypothetical protein